MKLKVFIILFIFFFLFNAYQEPTSNYVTKFRNFITRDKDKLMDGVKEFRFISFAIPELSMQENPYWGINDTFSQEDAIKTIAIMGGKVTRPYVFSIKTKGKSTTHVLAPGVYNEECFKSFDNLLMLCNKYGVRLVVPFIDTWAWWGGITEFSAMRGKDKSEFWTDTQLKQDFKDLIKYVLNRKNTLTGIAYKDDPAILAWETGNELRQSTVDWTIEMAAYIKSIDPKHLVMDGRDGDHFQKCIDDPNIDIMTSHYYGSDFVKRFNADYNKIKGKKAFIVGEFGLVDNDEIQSLVNAIVDSGATGGMIWSLRQHDIEGGFRWHNEGGTKYYAYHYPGFSQGESYNEQFIVSLIHDAAYKINDLKVPPLAPPESAPVLLPIKSVSDIRWRGVVGARGYDVERANSLKGKWVVIGKNISDSVFDENFIINKKVRNPFENVEETIKYRILFQDHTTVAGKTYYYRIKAVNESGVSKYSNVEKIENSKVEYGIILDELDDFSKIKSRSKNLAFNKEFPEFFNNDSSRLIKKGDGNESIVYQTITDINSFQVIAYSGEKENFITIYASENGKQYNKLDAQTFSFKVDNVNKFRIIFQAESLPSSIKYLKIEIPGTVTSDLEIGKVVIGYGSMKAALIAPPKVFKYSGPVTIDDFEGYQGNDEGLKKNFTQNSGGGKLTLMLDKNNKSNGNYGLKYEYNFGSATYAGGSFNLNDSNWTGNDTINLWIKPDGSKNIFVIQFREANGEYWELRNTELLKGNAPQLLTISLTQFKQPQWGGKVDGKLDVSEIKEFSFFINKGDESTADSGTLYFDEIAIIKTK